MAGTNVRVTINDTEISSLFVPGGDGWDWMERVGREQLFLTLMQTPVRTGSLKASFNLALTPNGRNNVRYTVGSYSDHAIYVVLGTTSPIYADGLIVTKEGYPLMWIRAAPHSWNPNPRWARFVRGQTANDFMGRAADEILAKYG